MKDLQSKIKCSVTSKTDLTQDVKREIEYISTKCPRSAGNTAHIKLLQGEELTYKELLLAKCAECGGNYIDGRKDCEVVNCPAYPKMQYRKKGIVPLPDNAQSQLKYIMTECPVSAGNTACIKWLEGKHLTYKETFLALCAHCVNFSKDGRYDCETFSCPVHFKMPYRGKFDPIYSKYYGCNEDYLLELKSQQGGANHE